MKPRLSKGKLVFLLVALLSCALCGGTLWLLRNHRPQGKIGLERLSSNVRYLRTPVSVATPYGVFALYPGTLVHLQESPANNHWTASDGQYKFNVSPEQLMEDATLAEHLRAQSTRSPQFKSDDERRKKVEFYASMTNQSLVNPQTSVESAKPTPAHVTSSALIGSPDGNVTIIDHPDPSRTPTFAQP